MTRPTPPGQPALPPDLRDAWACAEAAEANGRWNAAREHYAWLLYALPCDAGSEFVAGVLRRSARAFIEQADFDAASDCLEVALVTASASNDARGVAHARNLLGIAEQRRGRLLAAEAHYRAAREVAEPLGDRGLLAMIDQNLGTIANIRGDLLAARRHYEESLEGYHSAGLRQPVGPLLNNLGMLYTDVGDWRAAEHCFSGAVAGSAERHDLAGQLLAEANRAELYVHQRRYRKAKRVCRRLLRWMMLGGDGQWAGDALKHLGVAHRETGNPAAAETYLLRALTVAERRQDLLLAAETARELAVLYEHTARPQDMLMMLNRAHRLFSEITARGEVSDIDRRLRHLEEQFLRIVERWSSSIESADRYTRGHCERVADTACELARHTGLDDAVLLWFRMGALLHDVGKVAVPAAVLNKPGPLTAREQAMLREHPVIGERLLGETSFPWDVRPMIRHHHERWDGTGYPDRLQGDAIPLSARLLCIADVFDALTSTRPYREAFTPAQALTIMEADRGRAFDPALLDIFLERTVPRMLRSRMNGVASGAPGPVVGTVRPSTERTPVLQAG